MSERKTIATAAGELSVPVYRVASCHRWSNGPGPVLYRAPGGEAAQYAEVHTCGSVWHCPICAAKITSERRHALLAAIVAWEQRGGAVYLATRTVSHDKRSQSLAELAGALSKALSRAKGATRARKLAERAGVVGTVRALEVTHGEINGWHPHTHELIFARPGQRGRLLSHRTAWVRLLIKRGLAGMRDGMTRAEQAEQLRYLRRHAYTVQDGRYAAEYVAKYGTEPITASGGRWGAASELTRGHMKQGARLTGRTPFGLLALYVDGDKRAGMLFREFAIAFQGRAQLYWSSGLRASLAELCRATAEQVYFIDGASEMWRRWEERARRILEDRPDDEIAAAGAADCSEFVYRFSREEWGAVLRTDSRFDVLMAAQFDGSAGVRALLDQLRRAPPCDDADYVADWRRFDRGRNL